ncbi:transposase [Pectobacterium sp. CHL-2024]|uniref:transposase n=1 Tax=Pectobacterium sp. CHL-2024 TaxID=3377079 RepID=UPI0038249090
MRDEKSLAHTRWNCKYHIVFAPKYRRQLFYGEKRKRGITPYCYSEACSKNRLNVQ